MNESNNNGDASMHSTLKRPYGSNLVRALVHHPGFGLVIFSLSQPFLALAMHFSSLIATALALITLFIGLSFALISKDTRNVGYVAAYIAGAEVLWRMTDALERADGVQTRAARLLGMSERHLRYKLKKYDLEPAARPSI